MRFQAEIAKRDAVVLQLLMQELDVQSNAELIAHLLHIARWAVAERNHGRKIASVGSSGEPIRELISPLLERAAPEYDLPTVRIDWSEEEIAKLARVATKTPSPPNERLRKLMGGDKAG